MQSVELSAKTLDEAPQGRGLETRRFGGRAHGHGAGGDEGSFRQEYGSRPGPKRRMPRRRLRRSRLREAKPAPRGRGRKPAAEPTPETAGAPDPVDVPVVEASSEEAPRNRRGRGGRGRSESAPVAEAPSEGGEEAPASSATPQDAEALAGLLRELLESAGDGGQRHARRDQRALREASSWTARTRRTSSASTARCSTPFSTS